MNNSKRGEVRDDLVSRESGADDSRIDAAEAQSSELQRLQAERVELSRRLEAASKALTDAQLKYRNSGQQYARMKGLYVDLLGRQENDRERARVLAEQLENEQEKLRLLVKSTSFQLGALFLDSFRSVGSMLLLPVRLFHLAKWARGKREEAPPILPFAEVMSSQDFQPELLTTSMVEGVAEAVSPTVMADIVLETSEPLFKDGDTSEAKRLKRLRVAAIMDDFTYHSYAPECILLQLTPDAWEQELDKFQPDLVFIESAWRGKDELWKNQVGKVPQALLGILQWCVKNDVPKVFWNKEDPIHFETFLNAARLFDAVFTTDMDCIARYKSVLGHENVYLLPFAAQPETHNPVEKYERKDAISFAGAYYVRYPDRTRDLEDFVENLPAFRALEIFDRNFGKDDPNYMFPESFRKYIVGTLPYTQIDRAYKGYRYAINLNSIKHSQTMFARRIYELLASNTTTLSNYSRGIRVMFGDLVLCSDSGVSIRKQLEQIASEHMGLEKHRVAGLRKVLMEHTYQDRLAYIASKVIRDAGVEGLMPQITMIATASSKADVDHFTSSFSRQVYPCKKLILLCRKNLASELPRNLDITGVSVEADNRRNKLSNIVCGEWLAFLSRNDYYGPNYLTDLAIATRYTDAQVIGKARYHARGVDGAINIKGVETAHGPCNSIPYRSAMAHVGCVGHIAVREISRLIENGEFKDVRAVSVSEFDYCRDSGKDWEQAAEFVDVLQHDVGLSMSSLQVLSEKMVPAEDLPAGIAFPMHELIDMLKGKSASGAVMLEGHGDLLEVSSTLADGVHHYHYAATPLPVAALCAENGVARMHLEAEPGLDLQMVVIFFDDKGERISHTIKTANRNHEILLPQDAHSLRVGLRVYGSGSSRIKRLLLEHIVQAPSEMLMGGDHLLLTNHYPSQRDIYRNGFVHRRVVSYREHGVRVDVMRMQDSSALTYHEYEGVECVTGGANVLDHLLASGRYKSVLVHFLEPAMWDVLQRYVDRLKVFVWVHGSEIQPLHRREYNYLGSESWKAAKQKSDERMAFWRGILGDIPENLHLIFVSRYFAEEVMEDVGFRIPDQHFSVIHNPIDTDLFSYSEKMPEQRFKILSIRPYASRKYANDLSVKAILELEKHSWFPKLDILMVGDGALFDETLEPLRRFPNVRMQRKFLSHHQIARLHKEYGIFLCPTRMDAQGVSRDEAMSSGLVPVTNGVTAIPEFVGDDCGILAPSESYEVMALGIESVVEDPGLFARMSKAAAERVRNQSASDVVIQMEVSLFSEMNVVH